MYPITIHNRLLYNVSWDNASGCDFSMGHSTDIFRINIDSHLALLSHFTTHISPDELIRAGRYLHLRDKNRFIISRGALRIILGRYLKLAPESVVFETGPNKKPFIKNTPLFYNVSHSGNWIVIAVSKSEIGIDTEWVNPEFDFENILEDYFSPAEISYIHQTQSTDRFFMLWTRKEALTKATAKGLDDDLKFIPALDGEHLADSDLIKSNSNRLVSTVKSAENYYTSVASIDDGIGLRFWGVDF